MATWSKETSTNIGGKHLREYSLRSDGYVLSRTVLWSPREGGKLERNDCGWKRGTKLSRPEIEVMGESLLAQGFVKTFTATHEDADEAERRAEWNREMRRPRC